MNYLLQYYEIKKKKFSFERRYQPKKLTTTINFKDNFRLSIIFCFSLKDVC